MRTNRGPLKNKVNNMKDRGLKDEPRKISNRRVTTIRVKLLCNSHLEQKSRTEGNPKPCMSITDETP